MTVTSGAAGPSQNTQASKEEQEVKEWFSKHYGDLPQSRRDRGTKTFADTARAYHNTFDLSHGSNWRLKKGEKTVLISERERAHDIMLDPSTFGCSYLEMAWTTLISFDFPISGKLDGLPEGGVLSEDDVRAAAVTDESVLDDGGVYAVLILMGIYVGETGVFGPRFSQHACALDNGNDKLVKAKTVAKKTGAPVEELVLLPLPVRTTPGAVRHVFETLINVRCQATAPKNLNSNVWDTSFYRRPERISGKELKAFLVAVKKYVDGGGLLPKKGDPEWIGLQLKINDWAGRARMPKKAKPERAHKRAAEMRASLDSKFESKEDEDNYFVQFGIGKKRRGLR